MIYKDKLSYSNGFTLIEILIAIIIMGILLAIAIPNYFLMMQQAEYNAIKYNLHLIANAEQIYYFNNGQYCGTGTCNSTTSINTSLSLNINDNNYGYYCTLATTAPLPPSINCMAIGPPGSVSWQMNYPPDPDYTNCGSYSMLCVRGWSSQCPTPSTWCAQ